MSGVNEGIAGTLGFPADMANRAIGLGMSGINAVAGTKLQPSVRPMLGSEFFKDIMRPAIAEPTANGVDQFLRRTGQSVGASVIPGMGAAATAARPITTVGGALLSGLTGGAAAATAQKVAPGNPVAEFAADVAGSMVPLGVSSLIARAPRVPTTTELVRAGRKGYADVRGMGVDYSSNTVKQMAARVRADLENNKGIFRENAPQTFKALDRLENPPAGSVAPISGLMAARQSLGDVAKEFKNPQQEQIAARMVREAVEGIIERPQPGSVVAGPAADAARTYVAAKGNWGAGKRSARLAGIDEPSSVPTYGIEGAARLRAAAANSGLNLDNALRSRVTSLLLDPNKIAGFSRAEIAALEQVANGSASRNTIRFVGNWLGGGGGLGSLAAGGIGGVGSSVLGLPWWVGASTVPATGIGLRKIGGSLTARALRAADEAVRMRSPLARQMAKQAPKLSRDALRKAIAARLIVQAAPQMQGAR